MPDNFILKQKSSLSRVIEEDSSFYVVNATELKPKTQKTYEDAKGQLIADYQVVLESQWIEELKSKFSVKINEAVLQKVNTVLTN